MIIQSYKIKTDCSRCLSNLFGAPTAVRVGAMDMEITYIFKGERS